jgi:steroid 5-alpha reductase family enzyme
VSERLMVAGFVLQAAALWVIAALVVYVAAGAYNSGDSAIALAGAGITLFALCGAVLGTLTARDMLVGRR